MLTYALVEFAFDLEMTSKFIVFQVFNKRMTAERERERHDYIPNLNSEQLHSIRACNSALS